PPPPAKIRQNIAATRIKQNEVRHQKPGLYSDVDPAVSVKKGRVASIQFESFLVSDEHRHLRSILALVEDLPGLELRDIALHFGLAKDGARMTLAIEPINRARCGKARE